jgi:hypothetical protein
MKASRRNKLYAGSTGFQVCCVAGFQTRFGCTHPMREKLLAPADLEIDDKAGPPRRVRPVANLETFATKAKKQPPRFSAAAAC